MQGLCSVRLPKLLFVSSASCTDGSFIDRSAAVSLSEALSTQAPRIRTGIAALDERLDGGIAYGQITEVYGCPGSGKTAFAMFLTSRVVRDGGDGEVVWFECSQCMPASRFRDFIESEEVAQEEEEELMRRVRCVRCPTLSCLLTLLLHSDLAGGDESELMPTSTKVLVIDDLTTLCNTAFPPDTLRGATGGSRDVETTAAKRSRILTVIGNSLSALAITRNIAIVVLNKLTTKISNGYAKLEGPLGDHWSNVCATRILLYRDHYTKRLSFVDELELRWIAVQKTGGRNLLDPVGVPVKIQHSGFVSLDLEASQLSLSRSQSRSSQRQAAAATAAASQRQVVVANLEGHRSSGTEPASEPATKKARLDVSDSGSNSDDDPYREQ